MPRWDHLITATSYNQNLVKKQLLNSPLRRLLPDRIRDVAMHKEGIESFFLKVGVEAGAIPELAEFSGAEAALTLANQTMAVIAATNILEEFSGTSRGREMAEQMLSRSAAHLPESLRKRLAAVAVA